MIAERFYPQNPRENAVKRACVALGVLLILSGAAAAAAEAPAPAPDPRVAKLKAGVEKSFTLSLGWIGRNDPKQPMWGVTLSTQPVERLASEPFHSDVVIDGKTAAKLFDGLEKSGFFARAKVNWQWLRTPEKGYELQVTGAGDRFAELLGLDAGLLDRLNALRALLDGDAAKAMDKVVESVKAAMPEAAVRDEQMKLGKERAEKIKDDLKTFSLELRYEGEQDKPFYGMTLSTKPMMRDGVRAFWVEAIIDEATAKTLVDSLADSGVLGRARDLLGLQARTPRKPEGPCYVIDIAGNGVQLEDNLGWGKDLALELFRLRGMLRGEPGKQMDVLLGRLSGFIKDWTGAPYAPPK